jgi:uncharacterized membrane protein YeaQ/YmgE (transglycosylase-associated protein family)
VSLISIIQTIIVGAIIGYLGKLVVPGKQNIPWWLTIITGIVAAFLGTLLAQLLRIPTETGGIDWLELIVQVIVAAILVYLVAMLWARRGATKT